MQIIQLFILNKYLILFNNVTTLNLSNNNLSRLNAENTLYNL